MRVDDGCVSWSDGDGERGRVLWGARLRDEQPEAPDDVVAMIEITTDAGRKAAGDSERIGDAVFLDRSQAAFVAGSLAAAAGATLWLRPCGCSGSPIPCHACAGLHPSA